MFKIKRLGKTLATCGVVVAMTLAGMQSASAIVTSWDYDNNDAWTAYTPGSVTGSLNNAALGDPTKLEWGAGGSGPSSLVLGNNTGSDGQHKGSVATNVFSLLNISSKITHNNNPITGNPLSTFTLTGRITLTPTTPPPFGTFGPVDVPFNGFFYESPNGAIPCVPSPSTSSCDDVFVLANPAALVLPFSFAGENYEAYLTDTAGALGLLSDSACIAAGASTGCFGWQTVEGGDNVLNMALNVRSVPEPGSLALLALGLVGVYTSFRRKSGVLSGSSFQ